MFGVLAIVTFCTLPFFIPGMVRAVMKKGKVQKVTMARTPNIRGF